ncbi:hypothetical protein CYMTET_16528 [Cymbomonas tetramitiformis]|uniref:Uncharacterized protein n=1 Tax=Cymbomonas tetramitiformis TaxID=36881 RepID=A0AAE0GC13_9CHLO|nr:hypothetical protein CYMTET_16528 [Cymbomonas tetramitiformis]
MPLQLWHTSSYFTYFKSNYWSHTHTHAGGVSATLSGAGQRRRGASDSIWGRGSAGGVSATLSGVGQRL